MAQDLLVSVVKKSNIAYLKEVTSCLNYVFGCMVEKIVYSSLFKDRYKNYNDFINPNIVNIINEIKALSEFQKLCLLNVFNYLCFHNENKKHNVVYFTVNVVKRKDSSDKEYLFLMFNYNSLIDDIKCNIILKEEDKTLIKNILNKIVKIAYCNEQEYVGNKLNKLKDRIDIDNVLLLSNEDMEIISKEDFTENYIRSIGVELEQDKTILPIIECFEESIFGFNLKLF